MYGGGGFDLPEGRIDVPLHLIIGTITGTQDGCLLPAMSDGQDEFFAAPHQVTALDGVGHFPHLAAAEPVTKIVLQEVELVLAITSGLSDIIWHEAAHCSNR